jgi:hypothetical protein
MIRRWRQIYCQWYTRCTYMWTGLHCRWVCICVLHATQFSGEERKIALCCKCTCTRREGNRTHVRSDKVALHVDTISDNPSRQYSVVTAPICIAENAIVTVIVCEIRRHEIGWLSAARVSAILLLVLLACQYHIWRWFISLQVIKLLLVRMNWKWTRSELG